MVPSSSEVSDLCSNLPLAPTLHSPVSLYLLPTSLTHFRNSSNLSNPHHTCCAHLPHHHARSHSLLSSTIATIVAIVSHSPHPYTLLSVITMGYGSPCDVEDLRSEVLTVISGSLEQAVDNLATKTINRCNADTNSAADIPGLRAQIIGTLTH